jgi:hypothetical protein
VHTSTATSPTVASTTPLGKSTTGGGSGGDTATASVADATSTAAAAAAAADAARRATKLRESEDAQEGYKRGAFGVAWRGKGGRRNGGGGGERRGKWGVVYEELNQEVWVCYFWSKVMKKEHLNKILFFHSVTYSLSHTFENRTLSLPSPTTLSSTQQRPTH